MSASDIKAQIELLNEELRQKFTKISGWEDRIAALESEGLGTADIKEKVAKVSKEVSTQIDEVKSLHEELVERQDEMETSIQERFQQIRYPEVRSAGTTFTESENFRTASDRTKVAGVVVPRASLRATKDVTHDDGVTPPEHMPEIVRPPREALTMRDLVPGGRSAARSVEYPKLIQRAEGAAVVAEGAVKPESSIALETATAKMVKIAHYIPVTEEQLSDVDALRSLIDAELEEGIRRVEDAKILNGPGPEGTDILGIVPQATAYDSATYGDTVTSADRIDHVRGGIAQLQVASYAPTAIAMNPADWFRVETEKTSEGAYRFAAPQSATSARLWGLPVVATNQMPADRFLVGDFGLGAQLLDGQINGEYGVVIKTGYVNDQFIRNTLTILGESRMLLMVKRPDAFVAGDLTPGA